MQAAKPSTIHRHDYRPSDWSIDQTSLHVVLAAQATQVSSELKLSWQRPGAAPAQRQLCLDGRELQLKSIAVNGRALDPSEYQLRPEQLIIDNLPESCELCIVTQIDPQSNTALEGLYLSSGNYCTQCEAEGFRKITYYLDRPDVLSVFDVTIDAEQSSCPVLLANGNLLQTETLGNGWHRAHWHDPHPKPSYLFALVAGDLSVIEDQYITLSGRKVLLQIYVQSHNVDRCEFAMQSLKAAMAWDEKVYALEYDLDRFMIVAVDDFNMGAMENKGLNVFNSRYVLADRDTATDSDYLGIESVVAHEYFHNWTGNRITCRDWFQLSLKEGLTVFRDQCFSADRHSETVKRIEDVRLLRERQFPEDAGPLAHPIRPDSYIEINNFYTLTVYEKGAEVIRMLRTLVGDEAWHKGMDIYVQKHDGTATTCDAFIDAMQAATDTDLAQFRGWYATAGTPQLTVQEHYDPDKKSYELTICQKIPDTPGQSDKSALHLPLVMGLLDAQGHAIPVAEHRPFDDEALHSFVIDITGDTQSFRFENMASRPTASLLRGFSAPVRLHHDVDNETLALLISHDTDSFNRWDASQRLCERMIRLILEAEASEAEDSLEQYCKALGAILNDSTLDSSFKAEVLMAPSLETLAEVNQPVDFQQLNSARRKVLGAVAQHHREALEHLVINGRDEDSDLLAPAAMGMRKLANTALALLIELPQGNWRQLAFEQFERSDNMTDRLAALSVLCHSDCALRQSALKNFYEQAKDHRLVLDKWFAVQACSQREQVVDDVLALQQHRDFDDRNPNRLRSLLGNFAMNNPVGLHAPDGRGYKLLSQAIVKLDKSNPQVAARLITPLTRWQRFRPEQQLQIRRALELISSSGPLSADVYELVTKSLQ